MHTAETLNRILGKRTSNNGFFYVEVSAYILTFYLQEKPIHVLYETNVRLMLSTLLFIKKKVNKVKRFVIDDSIRFP